MNKKVNRQRLTYEIKASGINYSQVENGIRKFVIVPDDKKEGFEIGDIVIIQKYANHKKEGEFITRTISSLQRRGDGLMRGFFILGLENIKEESG